MRAACGSRILLRIKSRAAPFTYSSKTLSKRTANTYARLSSLFQTTRTALAVEASSLRFTGYALVGAEENLLRGWDDIEEDEDGT